ncbi:MAG: ATP-grasp domain-containing protein [Acidobacteriota bacterium]
MRTLRYRPLKAPDCAIVANKILTDQLTGEDRELLSEIAVRDEVDAIRECLVELGYHPMVVEVWDDLQSLLAQLTKRKLLFIFNLCESLQGDSTLEMCLPAALEVLRIPYTGSPPITIGLALHKGRAREILLYHRVPYPKFAVLPAIPKDRPRGVPFPMIVKPSREDGSLGISKDSVVHDLTQLRAQVDHIVRTYAQPALVEEYVDGREFNVAILGETEPEVLPISEIDFSSLNPRLPRIVAYEAKWKVNSDYYQGTVPICPANLPLETADRIRKVAVTAYRALGVRDYGRVDMRLSTDGTPYVIEVNPNPDISPKAGLARSAKVAGMSYTQLIERIVTYAMARTSIDEYQEAAAVG